MNRRSLTADIYSPIRFDGSLNESMSNADGSISEFYGGASNTGFKKDNRKSLEPIKDEDLYEFEEEPMGLFKTSDEKNRRRNSDLFSRRNTHLLFPTNKVSTSPPTPEGSSISPASNTLLHNESTEKEKVTPKKSPRIKGAKNAEKQSKDRLVTKRGSKSKQIPDKFITVRRDSRRSNLSSEMLTPVSSDHGEPSKSDENNPGLPDLSVKLSSDCSTQTDLTMTDLQILMNRVDLADIKKGCKVKMTSGPLVDLINQPTQIPANALEELKDTMDDEFHHLRQIFYLQQFSLGKTLYKNLEETENTNSGLRMVAESLNSIIGMLQEDRQLKHTVLSQRFNS